MNTPINPAQATAFTGPGPVRLKPARPGGVRRVLRAFGGLLLPTALLILSIGCLNFLDQKEGSGNVISEERTIEQEFTGVSLVGSPDLNVTVDPEAAEPKVVVTTDDNLLIDVTTEVHEGVLVIKPEGNLAPTKGFRVDVTVKSLASAMLTGSGDVVIDGIAGDAFTAHITGSGDMQLRGACTAATYSVTGSGDIQAEALEAKQARASVTGSGDVALTASESVDAKINGSGDISVSGSPAKVSRSVTGSGGVRVK
jgi:hypothetical protein